MEIDEATVVTGYLRGSAYCQLPLNLPHRWHHYDARCEPDGQVSHLYCPGVPELVTVAQIEAFLEEG